MSTSLEPRGHRGAHETQGKERWRAFHNHKWMASVGMADEGPVSERHGTEKVPFPMWKRTASASGNSPFSRSAETAPVAVFPTEMLLRIQLPRRNKHASLQPLILTKTPRNESASKVNLQARVKGQP
jgi:hypothetical protein